MNCIHCGGARGGVGGTLNLTMAVRKKHIGWTKRNKKKIPKNVKKEKINKMQQSDVYYQLLSQHVSDIIMPIFRRTKTVCYCIWCAALVLLDVVGSGCGALCCRMRAMLASYNTAPHNRYQPQPAEPEQHNKCSNRAFVLLKMGVMMPETCWDRS